MNSSSHKRFLDSENDEKDSKKVKIGDNEMEDESVNDSEEDVLEDFKIKLSQFEEEVKRSYYESIIVGTIDVKDKVVVLRRNSGTFEKDYCIDFSNLNKEVVSLPWNISPFGQNSDRVINEHVRCSKELRLDGKGELEKNILDVNGFFSKCVDAVVGEWESEGYYGVPYKLILYEEGGFFLQHSDTPEENLVKSMVINFNTSYEGGDFIINKVFNPFKNQSGDMKVVIFDPEVLHEVKPVESGFRLVLTAKIFKKVIKKSEIEVSLKTKKSNFIDLPFNLDYLIKNNFYNILVSHHDVEGFINLMGNLYPEIDIILVYSEYDDPNEVTDSYNDPESDCSYTPDPGRLLEDSGSCYTVQHTINAGDDQESIEYRRLYGYRGNSPCSSSGTIRLKKFALMLPKSQNDLEKREEEEEELKTKDMTEEERREYEWRKKVEAAKDVVIVKNWTEFPIFDPKVLPLEDFRLAVSFVRDGIFSTENVDLLKQLKVVGYDAKKHATYTYNYKTIGIELGPKVTEVYIKELENSCISLV